jgi:hypothetical protein
VSKGQRVGKKGTRGESNHPSLATESRREFRRGEELLGGEEVESNSRYEGGYIANVLPLDHLSTRKTD